MQGRASVVAGASVESLVEFGDGEMETQPNNRLEGVTYIYDKHNGAPVGKIYATDGKLYWGGQGVNGHVLIQNADDQTLYEIDAGKNQLLVRNRQGEVTACIDGETGAVYAKEFKPLTQAVVAAAL